MIRKLSIFLAFFTLIIKAPIYTQQSVIQEESNPIQKQEDIAHIPCDPSCSSSPPIIEGEPCFNLYSEDIPPPPEVMCFPDGMSPEEVMGPIDIEGPCPIPPGGCHPFNKCDPNINPHAPPPKGVCCPSAPIRQSHFGLNAATMILPIMLIVGVAAIILTEHHDN